MISEKCHQEDWIQKKRKEFGNADPLIIEKVIKAFTLLDALSRQKLSFVFKGGTALLLLLPEPLRFSIDIDIVIDERPDDLPALFDKIIDQTILTSLEEDVRNLADHIPKEHYKFYYNSILPGQQESYILLDVLFDENPYSTLISKPVQSPLIALEGSPSTVRLPNVDEILGDKLTAYAPRTTGIPMGEGKQLEIIKQLFDIGQLFKQAENLKSVRNSFNTFALKEIDYRSQDIKPTDVLDDIFHTSKVLGLRGGDDDVLFDELQEGINRISSYILSRYTINEAILDSAKAVYLAQLLRKDEENLERFDGQDLSDMLIKEAPLNKLNKVKKIQPEGFYYWYKTIELMD